MAGAVEVHFLFTVSYDSTKHQWPYPGACCLQDCPHPPSSTRTPSSRDSGSASQPECDQHRAALGWTPSRRTPGLNAENRMTKLGEMLGQRFSNVASKSPESWSTKQILIQEVVWGPQQLAPPSHFESPTQRTVCSKPPCDSPWGGGSETLGSLLRSLSHFCPHLRF